MAKTISLRLFLAAAMFVLLLCPSFAQPTDEAAYLGKMKAAVVSYIQKTYPEFSQSRIIVNLEVPDPLQEELQSSGAENFRVAPVMVGFRPFGSVTIPFLTEPKGKRVFVNAEVEIYQSVVSAKKDLDKKEIAAEDDFVLQEKEVAKSQQKYYTEIAAIVGKELKIGLKAGQPVLVGMLREKPMVATGDKVSILAKTNNVSVLTQGTVLEDGYKGDKVRVQRSNPKKIIVGLVDEPGRVVLEVK